MTTSSTGRGLEEFTLENVLSGSLGAEDVRISAETLNRQAQAAIDAGNPQLGENLRRAAELTCFEDAEILAYYEALRPRRSTDAELEELAKALSERDAPLCAALVSEAREVYRKRGLIG